MKMNMETHKPYGPYEKYFKRPIDFFCGILAVIVFSWLYVILITSVHIVIYFQGVIAVNSGGGIE